MIYDSVISTGTATISGCSSADLGTDILKNISVPAAGSKDEFFYDRVLVTGQRGIRLSVNGQTYLQEVPITGQALNEVSYQTNTGDFFIKGIESSIIQRSKLNFSKDVPMKSNYSLSYDVVTGGNFAATGDLGQSLKNSIVGGVGASAVFDSCDYFLNGQKVYSGAGIGVSAGTEGYDFIPVFGVGATYGGVVTATNKSNFTYTAYSKRVKSTSITGLNADVFSETGFIEGRTSFYINGIEQAQNNYLELYTGVSIIKKDVTSLVFSGVSDGSISESVTL